MESGDYFGYEPILIFPCLLATLLQPGGDQTAIQGSVIGKFKLSITDHHINSCPLFKGKVKMYPQIEPRHMTRWL